MNRPNRLSTSRKTVLAGAAGVMMAAPWAIPLAAQSLPAPGNNAAPSGADPTRNVNHLLQSAVDRELQGLGLDAPPGGVQVASGEMLAQTQRQPAGAQSGARTYTPPPAGQMSEVQKHLQELYQQDGQPMPQMQVPQLSAEGQAQRQQVIQQLQQMPPSIATGRKANKPWDWLKPSTWRRRFAARNYTPPEEPATKYGNSVPPMAPPMQAAPQRQLNAPQFGAPQFGGAPQLGSPTQAAQQPRLFPAPGGGTPVAPQVTINPPQQPSVTVTPQPAGAPLALQPQPTPAPAQPPAKLDAFSFETPESSPASEFELELHQPANVKRVAELEALLRSGSGAGDAGGTGDPSAAPAGDAPAFAQPAPGSDPLRNDFDPLAEAFPETPEAQADAQPSTPDSSSPFSGMRLDEDPFADAQPLPVPQDPAFADGPSGRPSLEVPVLDGGAEFQGLPMAPGVAEEPGTLPEIKPHRALPSADFELPPSLSSDSAQQKMARIASRSGSGLKGFCPVMLRDFRELVDVQSDVSVIFRSREYWFSSEEAKAAFLADPDKYAPAADGIDLVHFNQTGEEQEGLLDYSVWYRGRLYLFATAEAKTTFQASPREHATRE